MAQPITTYEGAIAALDHLYAEERCWKSSSIDFPVATSQNDDTPMIIDLAATLGKVRRSTRNINDDTCFFLPKDKYSVNTEKFRKSTLGPLFVFWCRQAGFNVIMNGWEPSRGKTVVICNRGKEYQVNKQSPPTDSSNVANEKKNKRQSTTSRVIPGSEDKCSFRMTVFWSKHLQRWYLPKQQSGCACHKGHAQRAPDQVRVRIDSLVHEEIELQEQMLKTLHRPTGVTALTYERTGIDIEPYQVSYLRNQMRGREVLANAKIVYGQDFDDSDVKTVADRLLLSLQARKDVSFVAIFAAFDTDELRIRSKKR